MKRKILIISILILIFTIVFSINASAKEEPEIDYNNFIAITQNGETITYPVLGMQQHTWRDYIESYTSVYGECPFEIHDVFITHKGGFITNRTGATVSPDDDIIVASGCVYNILAINNIYTVGENTIAFDARFEGYTFSFLIDCLDEDFNSLLTSKGHYGIYDVLYNSRFILGQSGPVQSSDTISSKIAYSLGEVACTEHVWQDHKETNVATCVTPRGYTVKCQQCGKIEPRIGEVDPNIHNFIETVITAATCVGSGSLKRECDWCEYEDTISIPATGHSYYLSEEKAPTCTEDGYIINRCRNCSTHSTEYFDALGHTMTEATCLQKSTCSKCGFVYGDYAEHQLKPATCTEPETCTTCGLTQGDALGHVWRNFILYSQCTRCNEFGPLDLSIDNNTTPGDGPGTNNSEDWWDKLIGSLSGDTNNNNNNSFNDEFEEFNNNTKQLLSLVMGFCVFLLVFYVVKELIRWIKLKSNRK